MIHRESDHPANQSNSEILGRVSGGFSLAESSCVCNGCREDIDHGDTVVVLHSLRCPSIYHRWAREAVFCRRCAPNSLDADALEDYKTRPTAVLVRGTLRDKGYWATYTDDEGERYEEWTYQDNRYAEFAGTRVVDRRINEDFSPNVTKIGPRQYNYKPSEHGETVAVPSTILAALVDAADIEDEASRRRAASENPLRWARYLLADHTEP